MKELNKKLFTNALIIEKLTKLDPEERQVVVNELLKGNSLRGLGNELGIAKSTLDHWKNGRQHDVNPRVYLKTIKIGSSIEENNKQKVVLNTISISTIAKKIREFEPINNLDVECLKSIVRIIKNKLNKLK